MAEKEVIRGTVEKIHFTRDGWSAGRLRVANSGGEVACWPSTRSVSFAGRVNVRVGEAVGLRGRWTHHQKWGDQFEADDVVFEERLDKDGLAAWLSTHEDAIGIGEIRARRVAERFGDNFTLALKFTPADVAKVAGVPLEAIDRLAEAWFRMEEFNAVGAKLSAWNLTRRQIETLYAAYGNGVIRVLEEDPYVICREVEGYGFRKADDIAQKLGTPKTHPGRIRAGVMYVISEALGEGSTCLKKLDLLTRAEKLLALDQLESPDLVMGGIEDLVAAEALASFGDGEHYAGEGIHHFERFLADWLRDGDRINPHFHPEMLSPTIDAYCGALDGSQLEAAYNALGHRFALISGGAGSGKTFLVNALCNAYSAAGKTIALCAPTGKASRRLEQVTGRSAQTIHRLLEYGKKRSDDPDDPAYYRNQYGFARNEKRPISASVVIVDEFSMCDVGLGRHLAVAIGPRTAVVFVGDHNQLPAVGPGAVLRDCLRHELMPATVLQHCHRQAGPLKRNCAAILDGIVAPSEPEPESGPAPWYVHRKLKEPRDVLACLERLYVEIIPNRWSLDPFWDVQFLTPMHKGELGTRAVNVLLQRVHQKRLGVDVEPVPEKGRVRLYAGDKVINTRNNYKIDVMNGHQGVVKQAAPLIVEFQDGETHAIPDEDRGDIELAFCISVHKCVHPETLVETDEGLLPIKLIRGSGMIATPNGSRAYKNKVTNSAGKAIRITTKHGYSITVTPEHRVERWNGDGYEMRFAFELREGDWLRMRLGKTVEPKASAVLPCVATPDVRAVLHELPTAVSPELAEFLGLMVADGTVYQDGFRLLKRHSDVVERFGQLCRILFGAKTRPVKGIGASGYEVNSTHLRDWLRAVGGMTPHAKAVPECVLRSPSDIHAHFLRGLFEDGTTNIKDGACDHIEWSTVYPDLARIVQVMLLRLGIVSTRAVLNSRDVHALYIYSKHATTFRDRVGFVSQFKQERLSGCRETEKRYMLPVSRNQADTLRESCPYTTVQNARYRGTVSRETARMAGWEDRLGWFEDPITSIEHVECESVCVEVPEGHRFLQNGFPFWNSQGSEWPCVVTVCHRLHQFMLHRNWLYTAVTRAQQVSVLLGDEYGITKAAREVKENERQTYLDWAGANLTLVEVGK